MRRLIVCIHGLTTAIALLTACLVIDPAQAACGEKDIGQCRSEFDSIQAIAWTGDGFTAVGLMKGAAPQNLAILRLSMSGESRGHVQLPWPTGIPADAQTKLEARKLIGLPDGAVVLLASIQLAGGPTAAWALRIDRRGQVTWNKPFAGGEASTLFHSGHYDPGSDTLILVGRRTIGGDERPGSCDSWSQSLVITVKGFNDKSVTTLTRGPQLKSLTNRQAIFDVMPSDKPGSYMIAGFATGAHVDGLKCQDDVLIGSLSQESSRWSFGQLLQTGANDADEVAFSIRTTGNGSYLLAGHGQDPRTKAAAAQVRRVDATTFRVVKVIHTSAPGARGLRFRVIVPLREKGRFLVAGSASFEPRVSQAMWQVISDDLSSEAPFFVTDARSSQILDAAVSLDGRVLAVGRWVDDKGVAVGWTGSIFEPGAGRRDPDTSLPLVSGLPPSHGVRHIDSAAFATGAGYSGPGLAVGSETKMGFSLTTDTLIKITARAKSGDVDLFISDGENRPVAFSNFRDSATEMLIATLPKGDYVLSIIAQTPVGPYEIRFARSRPIDAKALAELQRLSQEQRRQLAAALAAAGFGSPAEPSIAFGSETVRALLAIDEAGQDIRPRGIAKTVAKAMR